MAAAIGIDIGGSSVKAVGVASGRVVWMGRSAAYSRPDRDELVRAIRAAAAAPAAGAAGCDFPSDRAADAVGLCVPGVLDAARARVELSVNVPGLNGVSLVDLVGEALGEGERRVRVVNDANATAWDLRQSRELVGRLLVVVIGTGVGAAVLDEAGFARVDGESPGHLGQIDVSVDGAPVVGPDGGAGSLEGYIGSAALAERYGGDLNRIEPRDASMQALARAIRIAHALYRPHHVCLAGGTGIRMGRLMPELRAMVSDRLTNVARPGWTLTVGDSDFHAAAGAARLAMG